MFEDTFYIMETSPGWYQARMTQTHFCFSAGADLQKRLDSITKVVSNHRTVEHILKSHEGEDGNNSNHMSVATKEQHTAQYSDRGHLYDDDIAIAVQKGLKLRAEKDPIKKARNRLGSLLKKTFTPKEEVEDKRPSLPTVHNRVEEKPTLKKNIIPKTIRRTSR